MAINRPSLVRTSTSHSAAQIPYGKMTNRLQHAPLRPLCHNTVFGICCSEQFQKYFYNFLNISFPNSICSEVCEIIRKFYQFLQQVVYLMVFQNHFGIFLQFFQFLHGQNFLVNTFRISHHLCQIYIRVCDMSKTNVAVYATNCSFTLGRRYCWRPVGNLSTTNFWKPSGVGFGRVTDNVFNYYQRKQEFLRIKKKFY